MGIRGFEHLFPWLSKSKFEQLKFGEQVSLAGNGQCLPLMGSLAILALFGADLAAERALAEADVIAHTQGALSDAQICFV